VTQNDLKCHLSLSDVRATGLLYKLLENKADSYLKKISVRGNTMSLQF